MSKVPRNETKEKVERQAKKNKSETNGACTRGHEAHRFYYVDGALENTQSDRPAHPYPRIVVHGNRGHAEPRAEPHAARCTLVLAILLPTRRVHRNVARAADARVGKQRLVAVLVADDAYCGRVRVHGLARRAHVHLLGKRVVPREELHFRYDLSTHPRVHQKCGEQASGGHDGRAINGGQRAKRLVRQDHPAARGHHAIAAGVHHRDHLLIHGEQAVDHLLLEVAGKLGAAHHALVPAPLLPARRVHRNVARAADARVGEQHLVAALAADGARLGHVRVHSLARRAHVHLLGKWVVPRVELHFRYGSGGRRVATRHNPLTTMQTAMPAKNPNVMRNTVIPNHRKTVSAGTSSITSSVPRMPRARQRTRCRVRGGSLARFLRATRSSVALWVHGPRATFGTLNWTPHLMHVSLSSFAQHDACTAMLHAQPTHGLANKFSCSSHACPQQMMHRAGVILCHALRGARTYTRLVNGSYPE